MGRNGRWRALVRLALAAVVAAAAVSCACAAFSSPSGPPQKILTGTVTAVYDGDTLKVRLAGGRTDERVRLMAFLAKRFTFTRLYQTKVDLLPGPEKRDAYGRLLAYVRTAEGEMFNETLVREGYAYAYLKFPFDEAWKKRLKDAESSARRSGKGLWQREPYPVIVAAEAGRRLGEIVTVRFRCARSFKRGSVRILEAEGAEFDAVIPLDVLKSFPGPFDFAGRTLETTGLVELYKGRPQVVIGVPIQIKRVD